MKTKKRFLSILLSLVMVLGLMTGMSLTAYADNYNLWVGGTQVTSENMNDVFNDGKVSYTPAQGTTAAKLKLSGYIYEGKGYDDSLDTCTNGVIWTGENLIIELSGSNSIKNTETASESYAIYSKGNLSITGAAEAVLNAEGNYCGIYAGSGLTVEGGDITAKGGSDHGIRSNGPIQINNGKVDATSNGSMASGLSSNDKITINGGSVTANGDGALTNGIGADDIYINGGNVVASGKVCGINVLYKVVNKIPGIGWTNKEGTAGKTDIPVSTQGQNLSGYKKVRFQAAHIHSFTYAASGAAITATCTADGCTLPPSTEGGSDHVARLTIGKPTLETYGETGKSAAATLSGLDAFNAATGKSIAATDIKYVGRNGTTYAESGTAPTNAGKYTAKITVEGKTAKVDYEIAKAATSVTTTPTAGEITYGQTLADSTLTGGTASVAGTFAWKNTTIVPAVSDSQKTEFIVVFTPTNTNYGTTECKVKLTVNDAQQESEKHDTTPSGGGGGSLPQATDPAPAETAEQPTNADPAPVPADPAPSGTTQDAFTGVSEVIETSTDGTASVTSVSGTVGKTLRITGTVNQNGTNHPVSSFATESFRDVNVKNIFIDLKTSGNTQTVTFQPRTFKGSEAKKLTLRLSSSGQVKFSSGAMSGSKIKKVVVSGLKKKEFKRVEKKLRKSGYKGKIVKK